MRSNSSEGQTSGKKTNKWFVLFKQIRSYRVNNSNRRYNMTGSFHFKKVIDLDMLHMIWDGTGSVPFRFMPLALQTCLILFKMHVIS